MRPSKDHLFYMVTFNVNRRPIIFHSFNNAINYAEKNKQYVSGFYESQWFLMHDRLQRKYMKGKYNFLKDLKTNTWVLKSPSQQINCQRLPNYIITRLAGRPGRVLPPL